MSKVSRRNILKGATMLAGSAAAMADDDDQDKDKDKGEDKEKGKDKGNNDSPPAQPIFAYVGTYTPNGQGIHLFSLNPATGVLTLIKVAAAIPSPSWLAIHPQGRYLYAVNEISNFGGNLTGSVTAFSINRPTGDLTFLNVVSSQGAGPAHLSVDPLGKFVFVANYAGGSIAVLPINLDGSLSNASDVH